MFITTLDNPQWWSGGYGTLLLTQRSQARIPVTVAAFFIEAKMLEARVLGFRCTLKKSQVVEISGALHYGGIIII